LGTRVSLPAKKVQASNYLKAIQDKYKNIYKILILVSGFSLIGCQTAHKYNLESQGSWEAKALVKDLKQNKNFIVKIDSFLVYGKKMKLEVSSPFGDLLGIVLLKGRKIEIVNVQERKYYFGKSSPAALKKLLKVAMDPQIFYAIYFDRALENKMWSCTSDDGYLKECMNLKSKLKLTWISRIGKKKTVLIEHRKVKIQLNIKNFSPEIKEPEKIFQLRVPRAFRRIRI
jgi:hypothetical protein